MTPANTVLLGHSSGTEFMDGIIDEVLPWNEALSANQIKTVRVSAE